MLCPFLNAASLFARNEILGVTGKFPHISRKQQCFSSCNTRRTAAVVISIEGRQANASDIISKLQQLKGRVVV